MCWLVAVIAKADVKCIDGGPCLRFVSLYPLTRERIVASFTRSGLSNEVPPSRTFPSERPLNSITQIVKDTCATQIAFSDNPETDQVLLCQTTALALPEQIDWALANIEVSIPFERLQSSH
jgi:hypothetical protein